MKGMRFFITDVFCGKKYSGNQLATFLDCGSLPGSEMQQIAREMNFSETTFVLSGGPWEAGYDVRIFTPGKEIDFAGHPTLGTAFIINEHINRRSGDRVLLNLGVGRIPVTLRYDGGACEAWMDQVEPVFGDSHDAGAIADILGLPAEAIDAGHPVQEVSTGLPHLVVPLKSLEALRAIRVNRELYFAFAERSRPKCLLVFCPEGRDPGHTVSVRMFADYLGVPEDPATGSGNGCLAAYLVKQRFFNSAGIDIISGQGHEIGRPSLLHLKAEERSDGGISVRVGGAVMPVAEGRWLA
jgi:trans-2,3-dihydro-3-hydroxyanthranilate isomerase